MGDMRGRAPRFRDRALTAAQRTIRLYDLSGDIANGERFGRARIEFVPDRPAADIQIGAKSQRMDRLTDEALDGGHAG